MDEMLSDLEGFPAFRVPIYTDIEKCFSKSEADVLIDLTTPEVGMYHTKQRFEL